MKKLLAALLAASMALSLAACGSKDEPAASAPAASTPAASSAASEDNVWYTKPTEEVELEVWYSVSGVTAETFEAQVQAYMEENPNIKIEISYAGSYSDAAEKISANLLTGTAPDVALISAAPLYTGARGDYTIETLIEDPEFDKDDIFEGVWEYAMYDGRICSIPYGISVPVLYYNKDIIEAAGIDMATEAPKTWDDLYALAERAQANGNINNSTAFYGFEVNDAPWLFKSMLNQNGNSIIDTDNGNAPVYNDAAAAEVAEFWQKLAVNGLMPVAEHSNADKSFLAGNVAFNVSSSIRLARWTDGTVNYGVLPMPSFAEESVALGGNMLTLFPKDGEDAKIAAAWDLIKYLTNTENHTAFSMATGYLPIHKSAIETEELKAYFAEDERRETVFNQLENSWSYWHFDEMGTMDWILGDMLGSIENGTPVQEALDKGVEDLEREM